MNITKLPLGNRLDLKEDSNLEKAREVFESGDYTICFTPLTEISNINYLSKFLKYFNDISSLNFLCFGEGVYYSFLYEMPNLKWLNLDCMYPIDFGNLKQLETLSVLWNKKLISNFDSLANLEVLSLRDFDEKDLTKLSTLTNLKSLSITRSKIKSLKGIETLTNLEFLSLGAVKSLTDISDITTLHKLKRLNFDICWKLEDFSPIGNLKNIEILELQDCKSIKSIKFVAEMPKLRKLIALGSTIIQDHDTKPAKDIPIFWGSQRTEYNVHYPEKEIKE
ncbi:leucine-rich repeat domain-containing protein [Flavobacterium hercynium]|uniref:Disease resistance R13L4/SHOC-2-like LRR domain-containing protein n=1 Tax=Flavobacterium hercynium TaxID=387094 RepID=A0A226HR35_9FLAO|nr:hypothetical protein [Flavobacterium hercynium]OXA96091.1 hypothetical protein B0A66_00480 [Flavobacterium hercynium]SMP06308.1 hypothetical protein SAMN06265346_101617 [Flavobacterium hercynium]